jgi:hypothetical protein
MTKEKALFQAQRVMNADSEYRFSGSKRKGKLVGFLLVVGVCSLFWAGLTMIWRMAIE